MACAEDTVRNGDGSNDFQMFKIRAILQSKLKLKSHLCMAGGSKGNKIQ